MGAPLSTPRAYACTGGAIPSGSYASVTVTGACSVATNAVISVSGNVNVAPNAVLDAQSAPSTITVRGNQRLVRGSLLGLAACLIRRDTRQDIRARSTRTRAPTSPSTGTSPAPA